MQRNETARRLAPAILGLGMLLPTGQADAAAITSVDLNDFFADPSVSVAADGSQAVMSEDPALFAVFLVNDPGFGDPEVIVPGPGVSLVFEFDFVLGTNSVDEFAAALIDAATGAILPNFTFSTSSSAAGSVSFDLSSLVGTQLGLQFQLTSLFGDQGLGSTVSVSDVRLAMPVPLPGTALLFATALVGFGLMRNHATS